MKIAVFPGHCGKDSGAIDAADLSGHDKRHTMEAEVTACVASKIVLLMDMLDIPHVLQSGSFDARIDGTRDCQAGVEIHCDSLPTAPWARGYHVIYHADSKEGQRLSSHIDAAFQSIPGVIRAKKPQGRDDLLMLRRTAFPCVIVELGFLTNVADESLLTRDDLQYHVAFSIVDGIRDWMYRAGR